MLNDFTPINIAFKTSSRGRIKFDADVMTADCKTLRSIDFELDTASDFTTMSRTDLITLGYTEEQLKLCPTHSVKALTAGGTFTLQYITNVSIKLAERELQQTRIFFAKEESYQKLLGTLFGADLLKYFNFNVNYDEGLLTLQKVKNLPQLSTGEQQINIYSVETQI
jgi:hypothetical protein